MIGMAGVLPTLANGISISLPNVTQRFNDDGQDIPLPRAIFIDARAKMQLDELPAIMIVPQRTVSIVRVDPTSYKCTYEIHVYVTTDTVPSMEQAANQRLWMVLALREALLLRQELSPIVGEVRLDETSLTEVYGPIQSNPNTGWYAESYVSIRINTVEEIDRTFATGSGPGTVIAVIDLNMSNPYVP